MAIGTVLKMVAIRLPGFEASTIPALQDLFASLSDENHLAFKDPHELILGRMPVALSRPCPRQQLQ